MFASTLRSFPGVALRANTRNFPSTLASSFTTYKHNIMIFHGIFGFYMNLYIHCVAANSKNYEELHNAYPYWPGSRRGCRVPCEPHQIQRSRHQGRGMSPGRGHSAWPVVWGRRHAYSPTDQLAPLGEGDLRQWKREKVSYMYMYVQLHYRGLKTIYHCSC